MIATDILHAIEKRGQGKVRMNDTIIRKTIYCCPICETEHEIEIRRRYTQGVGIR
jgi:hypothetical protein